MDSMPMPGAMRERISGPTYRPHVVNADQRTTYLAAKKALEKISFSFVRGGPAQGKLTGLSRLATSDDMRGSRQVQVDVKLSPVPGGTEVAVLFSEIIEDDFNRHAGMGTTSPMRDTALYEVYQRYLAEALAAPADE